MALSHLEATLATLCTLILRASGMHVSSAVGIERRSSVGRSAFISDDGVVCKDGSSRSVESALALAKAGVKGGLYNLTYAHVNQTCSDLGFIVPGGEDTCHPGVMSSFQNSSGPKAYLAAEEDVMKGYASKWGLAKGIVSLMAVCTCHPDSIDMANNRSKCDQLDEYQGSWANHNPVTGKAILCETGPFIYSTLALAVVKSCAELPMHEFDTVAPVGCTELGFPHQQFEADHCFPAMHMSMETKDQATDPGVQAASDIEHMLFGGGFAMWAGAKHKDLDMATLGSQAGCHCTSTSTVYHSMAKTCKANKAAKKYSPVREWWDGQVP